MKIILKHLSYANIVATLALLLAMSSGALAADHYLINSTKQINPKVLKALKGKTGKTGATGPPGANGSSGTPGAKGETGANGFSALSTLPSGSSESGDFGIYTGNSAGFLDTAVSFPIPLATPIPSAKTIWVEGTESGVPHCGGPGKAEAGFLCVYKQYSTGVADPASVKNYEHSDQVGTGTFGFQLEWTVPTPGVATGAFGTWTVTAP
jgi:hypothetical protein